MDYLNVTKRFAFTGDAYPKCFSKFHYFSSSPVGLFGACVFPLGRTTCSVYFSLLSMV